MTLAATMGAALLATAGNPATYTPPGGLPVVTRAVLERALRERPDGVGVERVTVVYLPAADVPDVLRGGTVQLGADTWLVDRLDDADGAVVSAVVRPA